jgi:hypothetical protein
MDMNEQYKLNLRDILEQVSFETTRATRLVPVR